MTTPAEMRTLATTLEEIAPHVDTDYGPGQVATYGLAWEALRSAAGEIERLKLALADAHGLLISYGKTTDHFENLKHDVELHFSAFRQDAATSVCEAQESGDE